MEYELFKDVHYYIDPCTIIGFTPSVETDDVVRLFLSNGKDLTVSGTIEEIKKKIEDGLRYDN